MTAHLNIAHSEFDEQSSGLMICGYEWGYPKEDQANDAAGNESSIDERVACTFVNKDLRYGARARKWRYDQNIIKWFGLWGHSLDLVNPGIMERSIIQTNWCDTQNHSLGDVDIYTKLTTPDQVDNFMQHIAHFKPRVILFMGSKLIKALQFPSVLENFESQMGKCTIGPAPVQKSFSGRRFKVWFQSFEKCEVVCLPHPSSSHGLSDAYVARFSDEMGGLISRYKREKLEITA